MTNRIRKILIANRGEIVSRIIKTCREMGIATAAIFSDPDNTAKFVTEADEAVSIGGMTSQESYLNISKIIAAAQKTHCDAIHPGYGFLSENAEFAKAVCEAGLIFIGPTPDTIQKMGDKTQAKQIMLRAKVPTVPGYHGDNQQKDFLIEQALKIGFPCLIKASAGGGGKGLKLVYNKNDLPSALDSAAREAKSAFNDDKLLIEKYLESARHIEVQIFGDTNGHIIHLFERECSLQRRHQKVIEESPATTLTPSLRKKITKAALKAAKAVHYVGAGTVEFVLGPDKKFYFLEMNTRLQVEHPVTEMITGFDLVKMQIECAEGKPLGFKQKKIKSCGHAMEARIYAEDPQKNFLPVAGKILRLHLPAMRGIRYEVGISQNDEIPIYYDPLIGKIIAEAATREACIKKLSHALQHSRFLGTQTNINFLLNLLNHPDHVSGNFNTSFIDKNIRELIQQNSIKKNIFDYLIAATLCRQYPSCDDPTLSVQNPLAGFRNLPQSLKQKIMYEDQEYIVCYTLTNTFAKKFEFEIDAKFFSVQLNSLNNQEIALTINTHRLKFDYALEEKNMWLGTNEGSVKLSWVFAQKNMQAQNTDGNLKAPLPGKVLKVFTSQGQNVQTGETLMIVEAMKMEHAIKATSSGKIRGVFFKENDLVKLGDVLVEVIPFLKGS